MRHSYVLISIAILLSSCTPKPSSKYLTYQNIVILSDLSSRIENMPLKDSIQIHKIINFFKDECVKPGMKIGDKSSITFSTFSQNTVIKIDIDSIKGLSEKQQFINSTGKYKSDGLLESLNAFESKVSTVYNSTRNPGLDLISMLIEKIENEKLAKPSVQITDGIDTTFVTYETNIYIFTDGYLEYSNKQANKQFYFGAEEIEKVRRYCYEKSVSISSALLRERELSLPPYPHPDNHSINLHILETQERDKDARLQTYKNPSGLRDNQILEAVWRKWALESNFKSLDWIKY